jgi:CubicO group peptidase (beta-lactamase class C family)
MRFPLFIVVAIGFLLLCGHLRAQPFEALEQGLDLQPPDGLLAQNVDLAEAMRKLHIPSADVALIENGRLAWSHIFGSAPDNAIYQAASLSKLVTAVAALRLVDRGVLDLDRDVNDYLTGWRVPENDFTRDHPVTLRGLLSMTAGVGVPGYPGKSCRHCNRSSTARRRRIRRRCVSRPFRAAATPIRAAATRSFRRSSKQRPR